MIKSTLWCVSALATLFFLSGIADAAICTQKPDPCLRKYVKNGDFESAAQVFNKYENNFRSKRDTRRRAKALDKVVTFLHTRYRDRLASIESTIDAQAFSAIDASEWHAIRRNLASAEELLDEIHSYRILDIPRFELPGVNRLEDKLIEEQALITNSAKTAFVHFDHGTRPGFFDTFPRPSDDATQRKLLIESAWPAVEHKIRSMANTEKRILIANWRRMITTTRTFRAICGNNIADKVAAFYFDEAVDSANAGDLNTFLADIEAAEAAQLEPLPAIAPKLVLISSEHKGEVNTSINYDDLSAFSLGDSQDVLDTLSSYSVVAAITIQSSDLTERTTSIRTEESKYQAGTTTATNPAYLRAQSNYARANNDYQLAQGHYYRATSAYQACQAQAANCIGSAYVAGAAARQLREAGESLTSAQSRLSKTSPTVTKPDLRPYSFQISNVEIQKIVDGQVSIFLPTSRRAWIEPLHIEETTEISIASNVHPADRGTAEKYKSVENFRELESRAIVIKAADRISPLFHERSRPLSVNDNSEFLAGMLAAQDSAPVLEQRRHLNSIKRAAHPAIGSVAVVRTPVGGLGSAFFVDSHLLLTNFHIVDGFRFVEVEFYNEQTATGEIVKTDIDRDLALIRTDAVGKPLALFSQTMLPLGESVVAVGHPHGLKFTLTKGIVSAIREQANSNSMGLTGLLLFVQTDTAISPGSSGGPLLLNDQVIGINTEKLVGESIEGIGFALHYTEIARFLASYSPDH